MDVAAADTAIYFSRHSRLRDCACVWSKMRVCVWPEQSGIWLDEHCSQTAQPLNQKRHVKTLSYSVSVVVDAAATAKAVEYAINLIAALAEMTAHIIYIHSTTPCTVTVIIYNLHSFSNQR